MIAATLSPAWLNVPTWLSVECYAAWFLAGLIWTVQVVHYPLMRFVPEQTFAEFSRRHQRQITWVVAPAMFVELTACGIVSYLSGGRLALHWLTTAILAGIWLSTALVQVPLHRGFLQTKDDRRLKRLVMTNWMRTLGWTVRAVLLATLRL